MSLFRETKFKFFYKTFDYQYNTNQVESSVNNRKASIVNLFYMNNYLHDLFYDHGFDEASGNAQAKNYGRGGEEGDAIRAEVQDNSGFNNANMSTPADGRSPRMQMYLWYNIYSAPEQPFTVNSPADIAGNYQTSDNVFSPGHANIPIAPAIIQSDLVLYDDGTPEIGMTDNADACSAAINAAAINGKIAVVRRSDAEASGGTPCPFTEKVKNAQNAGATAVIVVNNVPENISMSDVFFLISTNIFVTVVPHS